jgi:hypothetical protein
MKRKLWLVVILAFITLFTAVVFGEKSTGKIGKGIVRDQDGHYETAGC